MLQILMERNGRSGNDVTSEEDDKDDENVITVMTASNMALHLRCFVMTKKDVPNHVLDSVKFSKK